MISLDFLPVGGRLQGTLGLAFEPSNACCQAVCAVVASLRSGPA